LKVFDDIKLREEAASPPGVQEPPDVIFIEVENSKNNSAAETQSEKDQPY